MIGTIFNTAMIFAGACLEPFLKGHGIKISWHFDARVRACGRRFGLKYDDSAYAKQQVPRAFHFESGDWQRCRDFWTLKADSQALLKNTRTDKRPRNFNRNSAFLHRDFVNPGTGQCRIESRLYVFVYERDAWRRHFDRSCFRIRHLHCCLRARAFCWQGSIYLWPNFVPQPSARRYWPNFRSSAAS